ncbi:MAG: hypothetical protein V3U57_06930 [Robiginitomaculum sp.]
MLGISLKKNLSNLAKTHAKECLTPKIENGLNLVNKCNQSFRVAYCYTDLAVTGGASRFSCGIEDQYAGADIIARNKKWTFPASTEPGVNFMSTQYGICPQTLNHAGHAYSLVNIKRLPDSAYQCNYL